MPPSWLNCEVAIPRIFLGVYAREKGVEGDKGSKPFIRSKASDVLSELRARTGVSVVVPGKANRDSRTAIQRFGFDPYIEQPIANDHQQFHEI